MTSLSVDEIRAEAAKLDPLKVLITVLTFIPALLGWVARIVWVVFSLLWAAVAVGWKAADTQIKTRTASGGS